MQALGADRSVCACLVSVGQSSPVEAKEGAEQRTCSGGVDAFGKRTHEFFIRLFEP
jgi:hypothetical protein